VDADPRSVGLPGYPFSDFAAATRAVLALLRDRTHLRLWMVTRAVGDDQIVLKSENSRHGGYSVQPGVVLDWGGSLCSEMVAGNGPFVAPRVADVPSYAAAQNRGGDVRIEAYVGVPLHSADGSLFGTLCGFDPEPQPDSLRAEEQLVLLQAQLLATVLAAELDQEQQLRRAERAEAAAKRDALTNLWNRRGWDDLLAVEESRSARYGHPGVVLVIDLNGLKAANDSRGHAAGDDILRECAAVLAGTARQSDVVARLGGDEFGVLAVETDPGRGAALADRITHALVDAGVDAAIGLGVRAANGSLHAAWQIADAAMYDHKQHQRLGGPTQSTPGTGANGPPVEGYARDIAGTDRPA
jgi:diguanylate cyclase (GGDEF)-like protein